MDSGVPPRNTGSRVTAEIGPHHFALSDEDILREPHSKYKMNPPLRTPADVEEMKRALADWDTDDDGDGSRAAQCRGKDSGICANQ